MKSLDEELEGYSEYWRKKILRNVARDQENEYELRALGWTVLRIWESDIKRDLSGCVQTVKEALFDSIVSDDEVTD